MQRKCRGFVIGLLAAVVLPVTATAQVIIGPGPGGDPQVLLIDSVGTRTVPIFDPAFLGGVSVTLGDVNGDGTVDIIAGAGPGGGPQVRVLSGTDLSDLANFYAFDPSFNGGVRVASGDINGDGRADIIVGAGAGAGPHVRVFSGLDLSELASFYAFPTAFTGGVTVAAGDVDGDGLADIVTGAGAGGGPHVRVFSGADLRELANFYAYDADFGGGVSVSAGDFDGDGLSDIVTGAGPGGGPHVRVFSGLDLGELVGFYGYDPAFGGGANVAVGDIDGDGRVDLILGAGPGGGPHVRILSGLDFSELASFYAPPGMGSGISIGSVGDLPGLRFTSAAATTFTAGSAGTFTVTTAGNPAPAIAQGGALPSGVTFTDNGDGTASLAGTPAAGTAGTYPLTLMADNGVGTPALQSFTLLVNPSAGPPPAFTSGAATSFSIGTAGTFTVTTSGSPTPSITLADALPAGVTFTDNGNGTATLAGTAGAGTAGLYLLTFTATNTAGTVNQTFTLTVNNAGTPTFTSSNTTSFTVGTPGNFTVTTVAFPIATTITPSGLLPAGVTFVNNGNGTATLSGTPAAGSEGNYPITFEASNGGAPVPQTFTLVVNPTAGGAPTITSANTITFVTTIAGSFTITTTGSPAPAVSATGDLPTGVSFIDNGDGTATLSGPAAAGTTGSYPLIITATNPAGTATQSLTLNVNALTSAPVFTSAPATTLTLGTAGTFAVTAVATPAVTSITLGGAPLPAGLLFTDNLDGTASLTGTPDPGTAGQYTLTFTATNGGAPVVQHFTLTILQAAEVTSADHATFVENTADSLTITTEGLPTPVLSVAGAMPAGVSFVDNGDGTGEISGTPALGSAGIYPLTITAVNGVGAAASQPFTLRINDVPVAANDSYTVDEAGTLTVPAPGVMANDTNLVGTLTATLVTGPALAASFTFNPDGSFTYTHNGSETPLTATFTYRINDGSLDSNDATVTITITPQADPPVAVNDARIVAEGGTLGPLAAAPILANDSDIDTPNALLTAVLVAGPAQASAFSLNSDGTFTYTHNGSETTTDSFTYQAFDGALLSNIATVTITITAVNDAPVANDDNPPYVVNEGGTFTQAAPGILFNDTDAENNALTAVLVRGPAHAAPGGFTLSADGSFTYTHDGSDSPATDTFTYRVNDGLLGSNIATVTITITPVNDAPVAVNDAFRVDEGGTLTPAAPGVLGNDADVDGNTLTAVLVAGPAHAAAFTLNPDGSFSYTHDGSETPLIDTFTYRANDGLLGSNIATVTITITPIDDAPVAVNDAFSVAEGGTQTPAAPGVLANDADADTVGLMAFLVAGPAQASAFTLNTDGSFSYTHNGSETVADSFTYQAFDGIFPSNIATVTITITPVNDAPAIDLDANDSGGTSGADYAVTFTENNPVTLLEDPVDATITDVDSTTLTTLTVTLTNLLDGGQEVLDVDLVTGDFDANFTKTFDTASTPGQGILTIAGIGPQPLADFATLLRRVTYQHTGENPDATPRVVTVVASDGTGNSNTATSTVTVVPLNDPPTAVDDGYAVSEGATLTVTAPGVLTNDTDSDTPAGSLVVSLVAGPANAATFTLNADGSFTYTHDGTETTTDAFTYKLNDGGADSNTATVTITIGAQNDPPAAIADHGRTDEDTVLTVPAPGVLANDLDPDPVDTRTVVAVNGSAANVNTSITLFISGAVLKVNSDGSYSYDATGRFDFLGQGQFTNDSFNYTMQDAAGLTSTTAVFLEIIGVNDAPSIDLDADDDGDGVTPPATGSGYATTFTEGDPAVFIGDEADATITDVDGPMLSSITVTLTNLLDPTFEVLDVDLTGFPNFSKTYDTTTDPTRGVLSITTVRPQPRADFITVLRRVTYRNTDTSADTTPRVIEFVVNDGAANSNTATATVTVQQGDDPPTADNDSYNVNEGSTLNVPAPGVLDGDVDPEGDTPITALLVAGPAKASSFTLNADGSFQYTHNGADTTPDSFTYRAVANGLQSAVATVTITINDVNIAPTAVADTNSTTEDAPVTAAAPGVLANDTDPDAGDTKTVSAVNGVAGNVGVATATAKGATVTLNANGSYTYNPGSVFQSLGAGETDTDTFTYTLQDTAGAQSNTATVTMTINGANDAPAVTAGGGSAAFAEDGPAVAIAPGLTVTDVDDTILVSATVQITVNYQNGQDVLALPATPGITGLFNAATGTLTLGGAATVALYQAALRTVTYNNTSQNPGTLPRTVQFQVNDGTVNSNTSTRGVTVAAVNDAPTVAAGNTLTFTEGNAATAISPALTVADVDDTNLESATVTITANYVNGQDVLAMPAAGPITAIFNAATGQLALAGSATVAAYQAALRTVTYFNNSITPSTAPRTVAWVVNDGTVSSNIAASMITVTAVNSAPIGVTDAWTTFGNTELVVDQAGPATPFVADTTPTTFGVLANDTDPEGDARVVTGIVGCADTTAPFACTTTAGGSVTMESNGRFTYRPQAGDTGADTFQYVLTDVPLTGVPGSVNVTVNLTLQERIWYVDGDVAGPGTGTSSDPFKALPATAGDADDYVFVHNSTLTTTGSITLQNGQKLYGEGFGLSINQALNGNPAPVVLVAPGASPDIAASTGNAVGVLANSANGNRTNVEIRGLTLATTAASSNAIDITTADAANVAVTISGVTVTGATAEGIDINQASAGTATVAISNVTVTSTGNGIDLNETAGTLTVTSFNGITITGDTGGSGIVVANATFDATAGVPYNQVAGGTTAVGTLANPVGGAGVVLTTVSGDLAFTDLDIFSANGAALLVSGTGAVNAAAGTGTLVSVASGVATLQSTGGPVVGVNTATANLPLASASVTSSPTTGITLVNVASGTTAASVSASSGSIASTTGISVNVDGGTVSLNYGGNITKANSFAMVSVSGGHTTGTITFGGTLNATNGTGLQFDNADSTYNFTGTTTLNGGDAGIDILNGSTGTFSFGTGTTITNPSGTAFLLSGSTANVTYSGSITDNTGFAVDIDNHDAGTVTFQTGTITSTGTGLRVANSNGGTINFNSPTIALTTGTSPAVTLDTSNAGGTINFTPAGGGSGLDISTTTGTGFSALGGGTISVTGTGNTVVSSVGAALDVNAAIGAGGLTFGTTSSAGGARGVRLTNVTGGAIALGGGSLAGATTAAFTVGDGAGGANTGGTSVITYTGTIAATGAARTVDIQDRAAGAGNITLSGALSHSGNGNGVFLDQNAAGTIAFTAANSVLNGGTSTAVSLTNNTGATINFTGGGLDIDATSGGGFVATGGGTVNVTLAGNTIATTTGTALNVTSTTIGASGLTFRSISANGAPNGIVLSNTGTTGGLSVTGDGGGAMNGSGGTIQNTTGVGISLTTTRNVSLTQLNVASTGSHGLNLSSVTNFTFQDASVISAGDGNDEQGFNILNVFGTTNLIEDVRLDDITEDGIQVRQNATDDGTMDTLTIRRVTVEDHVAGFGESGIEAQPDLGSNFRLIVDDCDFTLNTNAVIAAAGSTAATHTGTFVMTIQNSTFNAGSSFGSGGPQFLGGGSGTVYYTVSNNQILGTKFSGLILNNDDTQTTHARVVNNTITGSGATNNGNGISMRQDANGTMFAFIDNNTISLVSASAISLNGQDATTDDAPLELHAIITNNTVIVNGGVPSPGTPTRFGAGIIVEAGVGVALFNDLCADVSGNNVTGTNTADFFDSDVVLNILDTNATMRVRQTSGQVSTSNNGAHFTTFANPPAAIVFNGGTCTAPLTPPQ